MCCITYMYVWNNKTTNTCRIIIFIISSKIFGFTVLLKISTYIRCQKKKQNCQIHVDPFCLGHLREHGRSSFQSSSVKPCGIVEQLLTGIEYLGFNTHWAQILSLSWYGGIELITVGFCKAHVHPIMCSRPQLAELVIRRRKNEIKKKKPVLRVRPTHFFCFGRFFKNFAKIL